jgi:hypothetical protein
MSKVVLDITTSLDGFIAAPNVEYTGGWHGDADTPEALSEKLPGRRQAPRPTPQRSARWPIAAGSPKSPGSIGSPIRGARCASRPRTRPIFVLSPGKEADDDKLDRRSDKGRAA